MFVFCNNNNDNKIVIKNRFYLIIKYNIYVDILFNYLVNNIFI